MIDKLRAFFRHIAPRPHPEVTANRRERAEFIERRQRQTAYVKGHASPRGREPAARDDGFGASVAAGAATDNAAMGWAVGGNPAGAMLGAALRDSGDSGSSYSSGACSSSSSSDSSSSDSGGSCGGD